MHHFHYQDGELYAEDVPVRQIARKIGTPFYLYSTATLKRHYQVFDEAFSGLPHLICYSVKANSNLAVLRLFAKEGSGADIVSGGELYRALKAGLSPKKIVFSGVGKTPREMREALKAGILMFNVESLGELKTLAQVAKKMGKVAPVAVRINPDVDPKTHPYISTGLKKNKFGLDLETALEAYLFAKEHPHLEIVGVDCHIGSQLTEISPFVEALKRIKAFVNRLKEYDIQIKYIDLGGGLGIVYGEESPPPPREYAQALKQELSGLDVTLILEPGRVLVGNAGILVTKVLYFKETPAKKFLIVDAAMNDLLRPAFYQAYHEIIPVLSKERPKITVDVVGPICETGDFFARDRELPMLRPGELLAIMSAGAYGFVMSSNYNSRPRPPEVMVNGKDFYVVRKRENYARLIAGEKIPPFLEK
ncbi:diaminopimelate decarboxylase [Thermodesulfatator autotrophicus]|uniref:Diaminopimelate decarboxylase n=1 Tax=Thermodesulfatator autotrophicus TaxID=1795632 RepID=A0A177EA86_9BACT|nr:diaminopimelate decarboxylase [Thermodesulfatator autotrophicus]OAG28112.1 diaminopimelate decarboxylase [Thermodesulfatator autotrophicus]